MVIYTTFAKVVDSISNTFTEGFTVSTNIDPASTASIDYVGGKVTF